MRWRMTPATIETIRGILELGWPAIVTVAFYFLARAYMDDNRAQIARLWDRVTVLENELIELRRQIRMSSVEQNDR